MTPRQRGRRSFPSTRPPAANSSSRSCSSCSGSGGDNDSICTSRGDHHHAVTASVQLEERQSNNKKRRRIRRRRTTTHLHPSCSACAAVVVAAAGIALVALSSSSSSSFCDGTAAAATNFPRRRVAPWLVAPFYFGSGSSSRQNPAYTNRRDPPLLQLSIARGGSKAESKSDELDVADKNDSKDDYDDENDDDQDVADMDELSSDDINHRQTKNTAEEQSSSSSSWFAATTLGSLLELSDRVKAEAAQEAEPQPQHAAADDQQIGRGGALVKAKVARPPPPRRWLSSSAGSILTSFVSPIATRWLPSSTKDDNYDDDDDNANNIPRAKKTGRLTAAKSRITDKVAASAKSVQKVWWFNRSIWMTEQMPSDEQDEARLLLEWEEEERNKTAAVAAAAAAPVNLTAALQEEGTGNEDEDEQEEAIMDEEGKTSVEISPTAEILADEKLDAASEGPTMEIIDKDTEMLPLNNETASEAKTHHKKKKKSKKKKHKKKEHALEADASAANNATVAEELTVETALNVSSTSVNDTSTLESNATTNKAEPVSLYISSGYWNAIDKALTLGFAESYPSLRVSTRLRYIRKAAAHATGLHGVLSGKPRPAVEGEEVDEENRGALRRRLAAIDRARRNVERAALEANQTAKKRFFWNKSKGPDYAEQLKIIVERASQERLREERRKERVRAIDKQMQEAQRLLGQLACEKDVLQRRPNPLWNYTTNEEVAKAGKNSTEANDVFTSSRNFKFPPGDLVDEYLDMLFSSGRLAKMNHTDLWRNDIDDDYEDEDELSSPILPIHLQEEDDKRRRNGNGNGNTGSWLLRNGLGEKIGVTVETAAYKSICAAVMSVLAKAVSSIHGVNIMMYSDIRLSMEQAPDLPPIAAGMIPGTGRNRNYAHDAIQDAMRRGARKSSRSKRRSADDDFVQRDAVVETLASQCLIACPLLNLFPIAWQRAMIGNCVTLAMAVVRDFCEGLEFQILGHRLSLSFNPITEEDMIRGMFMDSHSNRRRRNPDDFEAAVKATAEEVGVSLRFLDRWHERALGGSMLRSQIANLIARLVLSIVDDILGGSRMDLWASHAGGPRLRAGLEYRTTANYMEDPGIS